MTGEAEGKEGKRVRCFQNDYMYQTLDIVKIGRRVAKGCRTFQGGAEEGSVQVAKTRSVRPRAQADTPIAVESENQP